MISYCIKKVIVGASQVSQLITPLVSMYSSMTFLADMYSFLDPPRPNELLPEVSAQPIWRNIASQHSPTMRIKPITQSTGKRLRSSSENKTILLGGSRNLYISARKVIELWIETRAVISWVTPTAAFLMRQLIVASRLGKNWVPASSGEDVTMRSKCQNKV